jgi:hypothetical protein
MQVSTLVQLLGSAVGKEGRRSALATAFNAFAAAPEAHQRPLYLEVCKTLGAQAQDDADGFAASCDELKHKVVTRTEAPVTWECRTFLYKQLAAQALPPSVASVNVIRALLDLLSPAVFAPSESKSDDYSRTDIEIRAAKDAMRSILASHPRTAAPLFGRRAMLDSNPCVQ